MRGISRYLSVPLWSLSTCLALSACTETRPTGQAIASIFDEEITEREVQHEMRVSGAGAEAALRALVARKILAREANRRDLQTDARYHFELRRAREQLLVDTLRRDLSGSLPRAIPTHMAMRVHAQPWRFADRFLLALEDENGNRDHLDSFTYRKTLPAAIAAAQVGTRLSGWIVRQRLAAPVMQEQALDIARQEYEDEFVSDRIDAIIAQANNAGGVRYRIGSGPARSATGEDIEK